MGSAANPVVLVYEDNRLTKNKRFDKSCDELSAKGIEIKRYFYEENSEQFMVNKDVWILITHAGIDMLPATYVNNHLMKIEAYPTRAELDKWLNNTKRR